MPSSMSRDNIPFESGALVHLDSQLAQGPHLCLLSTAVTGRPPHTQHPREDSHLVFTLVRQALYLPNHLPSQSNRSDSSHAVTPSYLWSEISRKHHSSAPGMLRAPLALALSYTA